MPTTDKFAPADIRPDSALSLLTVAEMARADAAAIALGTPGIALMENAGRAVAELIVDRFPVRRVTVLCGPGNNGGDGFVVARLLQARGWPVQVVALAPIGELKGDAALAAARWQDGVLPPARESLTNAELVVDGLFGAGLTRPLAGAAAELIDEIDRRGIPCVAIDVPSGVHGDSGQILGAAPHCAFTVTFFRAKPGHYLLPARAHCGQLLVADIGISPSVLNSQATTCWLNGPRLWRHAMPKPRIDDHKYRRGHALIVGGSHMTGAARLAALAARRIGVGMLTIAAEPGASAIYRGGEPGNIVAACNDAGAIVEAARTRHASAVLVGPGAGASGKRRQTVIAVLALALPTVLDADALSAFAERPEALFDAVQGPVLMTPHEGEFRRLFSDLDGGDGKLARTRTAAQRSRCHVLLKGADTVIAAPDGRAVINANAPPWLATAGAGDVLAGLCVGQMAQAVAPLAAGAASAWVHGAAAAKVGPGLIAEDLPLPAAQVLAGLA